MFESILFGIVFAATFGGIAAFRYFGADHRMFDIPNERSSHVAPTLRGAGVVMVAVCLVTYLLVGKLFEVEIKWVYICSVLLVAAISWLDDVRGVTPVIRLLIHGVAAGLIVGQYGGLSIFNLAGTIGPIPLKLVGSLLSFLWIVWFTNAYNFMDGIDGLAGGQAVVAGLAWGILGYLTGDQTIAMIGFTVAASAIAFLFHNWPPASVFMGDVGSAYLGFTFATMPLLAGQGSASGGPWVAIAAFVFVWLFVVDSVFTFLRRALNGEKVWVAHRQHLYQKLVIGGSSHGAVSSLYICTGAFIVLLYFIAFQFRGIADVLLVLIMVLTGVVIPVLAQRKKV